MSTFSLNHEAFHQYGCSNMYRPRPGQTIHAGACVEPINMQTVLCGRDSHDALVDLTTALEIDRESRMTTSKRDPIMALNNYHRVSK